MELIVALASPVFLLFLDCVWQLWAQFPSRFQLTEDFLLALHDSLHLPLFSTFLANSQRERLKSSQHVGQSYTRVEGWRDVPLELEDLCDPPLPPVWDWDLQYSKERQASFTQPIPSPTPPQPLLNGNLNTGTDTLRMADTIPGSVFLLSRGSFSCPPQLPPWRSSLSSSVYRKSHRRALSSEHVPGLERLLKAWALADFPHTLTSHSGPQGPLDPYEPLLPLLMGPCLGLWRQCYLRGAIHAQAFSHPLSSPQPHPVERLSRQVQQLRTQLSQVPVPKEPCSPETPMGLQRDLNQNANNSTFLFPAARSSKTPSPQQSSRPAAGPQQSSRPAAGPQQSSPQRSHKHTFLFRASSPGRRRSTAPEAQSQSCRPHTAS
uniref:Myotubularin phosphatase domain-containing protein n=1 Tax=Knipowitschia caucasica TaxID=637954 RepID=A0AAV2MF02_KNICA